MSQRESQNEQSAPVKAVANAPEHEVDAHRNALGDALEKLSERGIDVEQIAEKAGVSTTDVDEMTHGDLIAMTAYMAKTHPELLNDVLQRFPAAQSLMQKLSPFAGMLGGFFQENNRKS